MRSSRTRRTPPPRPPRRSTPRCASASRRSATGSERLEVPAQEPDPQTQQYQEREELRPHHAEEAALADLAALLDHARALRLLERHQPGVARDVDLGRL